MKRLRLSRILTMASFFGMTLASAQQIPDPVAPSSAGRIADSTDLAAKIIAITNYVRWPAQPQTLKICVRDGSDIVVSELVRMSAVELERRRLPEVQISKIDIKAGSDNSNCHAIVFGRSPTKENISLNGLIGKPILLIGLDEEFCSIGGLICLVKSAGGLRVHANIDSIARSGLNVNPQLLRLSQSARFSE